APQRRDADRPGGDRRLGRSSADPSGRGGGRRGSGGRGGRGRRGGRDRRGGRAARRAARRRRGGRRRRGLAPALLTGRHMRWLVAGLGNPGERYAATRHNVGMMVVEELAQRAGARLRKARFLSALCAEANDGDEQVLLATSLQFMNESGPTFASLAKRRGLDAE